MSQAGNEKGMALLIVLAVVALLSALLIEFSFSTLVDLRSVETFRDRSKAYYIARGGVEAARIILQEDRNEFDHPTEFWGEPLAGIPVGEGDVSLKIEDLSGRLNINFVGDERGNPLPGYHRFIALCEEVLPIDSGAAQSLADALVNWFHSDKTIMTADDAYYHQQTPPYERRGAKLTALEELYLVRGFDEQTITALRPFIRVVGDEPININTAPAEVLLAWQHSAAAGNVAIIFDRLDMDVLTQYRETMPFRQLGDLAQVEGIGPRWSTAWPQGSVTVQGKIYQVDSLGRVNQGSRRAQAIVAKQGNLLLSLKME
ncbi:type II secretion system minor pseudopilin GspK [Pelovirga terrestris]|uniref:Type II secretion system minor pseudopilin GspK n=1 Tax=Pelovirga terrestris TaxID=2771352 RepID=A0A8J6QRY2_9BACT|nr:type II secretion system minor pseudopilin GspK [Pelovirga terrestris]MBD1400480.1 type II secretion system minor pseudopilin GspK [Pelovirga terrestris]